MDLSRKNVSNVYQKKLIPGHRKRGRAYHGGGKNSFRGGEEREVRKKGRHLTLLKGRRGVPVDSKKRYKDTGNSTFKAGGGGAITSFRGHPRRVSWNATGEEQKTEGRGLLLKNEIKKYEVSQRMGERRSEGGRLFLT